MRVGKLGTYVDGLSEWPIRNMEDALATIARGAANRMVASNHVNEHSSRSHLVSLIKVRSCRRKVVKHPVSNWDPFVADR